MLAEAATKLPSLVSGSAYGALLESLMVEALIQLADQKVSVKAVQGQESATKKALSGAESKFKAWATKEMGTPRALILPPWRSLYHMDATPRLSRRSLNEWAADIFPACACLAGAEWAAGIKVEFDSNSLKTGIGGVELVGFGGKITLTNTLQSRLMLAYETQLPALRASLFT